MKNYPELIIISEQDKGKIFTLISKAHTLGRSTSSDIQINDLAVSSLHCELVRMDSGSYLIRDMDSTNGTKINDKSVKTAELNNGDILRVGKTELLYSIETSATVSEDNEKTIIDLNNVGESEPITPMASVSNIPKANTIGKEKVFSKITIYLSILLGLAVAALILWLLVIS